MSARENLNEQQFGKLPLDEILKMPTTDAWPGLNEKTVADTLPRKRADMASDPGTYSLLRSSLKKGQTAPIGINEGTVFNGLHRIALAQELGMTHLTHSPNFMDTEDNKWNKLTGHMP